MKKCKYCQSEIDEKAKVCPVCKRTLNSGVVLRTIIGVIIIFIGIFGFTAACTAIILSPDTEQTKEEKKEEKKYATLEKFNKVQIGMTYEEVVAIMECEGTLSTDVGDSSYNMKIYLWHGEDGISNTTISFDNGKVSGKNQIGLR